MDTRIYQCQKYSPQAWLRAFVSYCVAFLVLQAIVWCVVLSAHITLVNGGDAIRQHFIAFTYLGEWYRSLPTAILSPQTSIAQFDPSINTGIDILQTFAYYGIMDPLNWIAVFFSAKTALIGYSLNIVIRWFAIGASFLALCRYYSFHPAWSVLGALAYVTTTFSFVVTVWHPEFSVGPIYLPLLVISIDYVWRSRSITPLALVTALSLASNIYFAFINLLVSIVVFLVLAFSIFRGRKFSEVAITAAKCALGNALAVLMSAVAVVPILYGFVDSSRKTNTSGRSIDPLISMEQGRELWERLIAPVTGNFEYSAFLGLSPVIAVVALGAVFLKGKSGQFWRLSFSAALILIITPYTGYVMNLLGYVSYRWLYSVSLLLCVAGVHVLSNREKLPRIALVFIVSTALMTALIQWNTRPNLYVDAGVVAILLAVAATFIALLSDRIQQHGRVVNTLLGTMVVLPIVATAGITLVPTTAITPFRLASPDEVRLRTTDVLPATVVDENQDSLARVSVERTDNQNAPLLDRVSVPYGYFSIMNRQYGSFTSAVGNAQATIVHMNNGLDGRIVLDSFLSDRFVPCTTSLAPYPFAISVSGTDEFCINPLATDFGIFYDEWYDQQLVDSLNPIEFQDQLLRAVSLPVDPGTAHQTVPETTAVKQVELHPSSLRDGVVRFSTTVPADVEAYLLIDGAIDSAETARGDITLDGKKKDFRFTHKDYYWPPGMDAPVINLGVSPRLRTEFTIRFDPSADLSALRFYLITQDLSDLASLVDQRSIKKTHKFTFDNNTIRGEVVAHTDGVLLLTSPSLRGWSATVDGKPARILSGQLGFIAIPLSSGPHSIEVHYRSPAAGYSAAMSALSLSSVALATVFRRRRRAQSKSVSSKMK